MAFPGISIQEIIKSSPIEVQERPNLKSLSYSEFQCKFHESLRIVVIASIRDKLLFGKAAILPSIHKELILCVAKTREGGIPQPVLSRTLNKEPKALYPIIKRLIRAGIIVRVPAIFDKAYTYNVLHKHFSPRNEVYSLYTNSAPSNMSNAAVKTPSASGLGITLTLALSKHALCKALEQSKDNFLGYGDLANILGIPYNKPHYRRRFRRLITSLVTKGYVIRCKAPKLNSKKVICGLKLVKAYSDSAPPAAPATQAVVGSIQYGVPMQHQIYLAILAAGDTGITSIDLRRQLYDMDRKIFEAYTDKLLKKTNDKTNQLVCFVWEFQGKLRFHRFFTREAFERLNLEGTLPKASEAKVDTQLEDVEVVEVESELIRPAPSITGAAREDALLALVHTRDAVVVTPELNKLLGDALGSSYKIDRKTLVRTIDKLVAENRLFKLLVKVQRLDGVIDMFPVLVDHDLGIDHPRVKEFVSQLREDACFKVRTITPTTYKNSSAYGDTYHNTSSKAKSTISQLIAASENGSPAIITSDDGSDPPSDPDDNHKTPAMQPQQRHGLVRSKIARLKLLHLGLLEIIADSTRGLHKQRTISTRDIFTLLSLECYLSIVPTRKTSDELVEYTATPENLKNYVGSVPDSIHRLIFDLKVGYKKHFLGLLQILSAMGLLVPLSKDCIDDSGVVHIPKKPASSDSASLSQYYHLPELFNLRPLLKLDQEFVAIQTYSLKTPKAAAMMWLNLQIITTSHKDLLHPQYESPELADVMRSMTVSRNWTISYLYTSEQRSLMDSYIANRASSDPSNNPVLCQQLALQFKMWPFQIRSYFLHSAQKAKHLTLGQQRKKVRLAQLTESAVLPKRQRCSRRKKPSVLSTSSKEPNTLRRRQPLCPMLDNELLHMYAIVKFRALGGNMSWVDITRELSGEGPDSHRRRVLTLLRYTKGQNRAAELINKWRAIYVKGISSGELQEKSICPITNQVTILTPDNPDPLDPNSYLPSSLPTSGFNLREQLDYFMANADYEPPAQPRSTAFRLPQSPSDIYTAYKVTFSQNSSLFNVSNVLFHLAPNTTIPLPAPGSTLSPNSELVSFHHNLYSDHYSSEVAFLDLARSQSFTTRFCNMSLDSPHITNHLSYDYAAEVTKVAIKMIMLAPKTTVNAILSTSFYSQFPHLIASRASQSLENDGSITKERLKKTFSTSNIRNTLNITCGYSANNYRPTDKFLAALLGVSPFHLFLLARLSHKELLRLTTSLSPPVSPFIGPGGVMALLSKLSSLELDLEPAHVPEAKNLAPARSNSRSKLIDTAFRHDFNVHVRLLDSPLYKSHPQSTSPVEPQAPTPDYNDSNVADELFCLIDTQGPAGLPVVQILEHFSQSQLEKALNRLVGTQPPLIYRVGMDVCRFVSKNHYKDWMICIQPSVFEDDLNASTTPEALMLVPHPWTSFNGTDNDRILAMHANATLTHIVKSPGISMALLLFQLQPLINRNDLYFLIEYLKEGNCIYSRHFVQPAKVGPFSPRESFREVPPPLWENIPHHPRGVTCYWPTPYFYLQRPDLSIVSEPPRLRSGMVPDIDPFMYSADEGVPPIFSESQNI
ncbi:hypothetical protein DSO57_1012042 [Entomophthora muscae]|uniref:Uncharacterized protein n=1 Tax=Entomophthora muscae TaxID=34485 RepID=A0ACC2RKY9_9FUNG|nr:hypothetical protein DSO57_1012042 [Entomophthora muscae]